jgi:hypothetical protein
MDLKGTPAKEVRMLDQEVFGPAVWQQCQDRHAELLAAAATCRVTRVGFNGRPRRRGHVGTKVGDVLISVGLKLGGRVRMSGANSTLVVYR